MSRHLLSITHHHMSTHAHPPHRLTYHTAVRPYPCQPQHHNHRHNMHTLMTPHHQTGMLPNGHAPQNRHAAQWSCTTKQACCPMVTHNRPMCNTPTSALIHHPHPPPHECVSMCMHTNCCTYMHLHAHLLLFLSHHPHPLLYKRLGTRVHADHCVCTHTCACFPAHLPFPRHLTNQGERSTQYLGPSSIVRRWLNGAHASRNVVVNRSFRTASHMYVFDGETVVTHPLSSPTH